MHKAFQDVFTAALEWCDSQAALQGWQVSPSVSGGLAQYGFGRLPTSSESTAAVKPALNEDGPKWTGREAVQLFESWGVGHDTYAELTAFNAAIIDLRKMQQQEAAESAAGRGGGFRRN